LNEDLQTSQRLFNIEKLNGVFFPELAIDRLVLDNIEETYQWCVIDEGMIDQNYSNTKLPKQFLYQYKNIALPISSRALTENLRSYPRWINQNKIMDLIEDQTSEGATVISANDVELFGHHYSERIHVLRELLASPRINFMTVSEAIEKLEPQKLTAEDLTAASWQSEHEDFEKNTPYAKWNHPENQLQQQYLNLINTAHQALKSVEKPEDDIGLVYTSAKEHFDHGSASCNLYWLSNDPWWHPELVEIGARHLIKVVRTLSLSRETKIEAEDIYSELIYEMWQYHWSGNVEKGYKKYREKREHLLSSLADLS
ncbi:hypothetical protein KC571_04165, partial [candidate division WWE3 bacterium]|nr:hypothetical protein [candidate division WWE3 bacterium]